MKKLSIVTLAVKIVLAIARNYLKTSITGQSSVRLSLTIPIRKDRIASDCRTLEFAGVLQNSDRANLRTARIVSPLAIAAINPSEPATR